jgi:TIR domain
VISLTKSVFISYSSEHKDVADRVALSLRGRGYQVFLDRDDLPPGGSFDEQIQKAVASSSAFVFLISPESIAQGRYTLTELKYAREKWPNPSKAILPVMVAPTNIGDVPDYLKAVTILEPHGNAAAEVSAAVAALTSSVNRLTIASAAVAAALVGVVAVLYFQGWLGGGAESVDFALTLHQPPQSGGGPGGATVLPPMSTVRYLESLEGDAPRLRYQLRYLDLERAGGPVDGFAVVPGASPFRWAFPQLAVKLANNTRRTIVLSSAIITVLSSEIERDPIIVFRSQTTNAQVQIVNEGWGQVVDPVLRYIVATPLAPTPAAQPAADGHTVTMKTFSRRASIQLDHALLERLRARNGVPADSIVTVSGTLTYGPASGRKSLKFRTKVSLKRVFAYQMPAPVRYPATYFKAGKAPQRWVTPIAQQVKAGDADQFLLPLISDRSARSKLNVSFGMTGGRVLSAGDVLLDLFVPRSGMPSDRTGEKCQVTADWSIC